MAWLALTVVAAVAAALPGGTDERLAVLGDRLAGHVEQMGLEPSPNPPSPPNPPYPPDLRLECDCGRFATCFNRYGGSAAADKVFDSGNQSRTEEENRDDWFKCYHEHPKCSHKVGAKASAHAARRAG